MNQAIQLPIGETPAKRGGMDRLGIFLSALCAVHCAVTPFLLLFAPAFGKIWSHPASHWGMALFVIPLAAWMITSGFRKHKRKWILFTGFVGIVALIIGAMLPYLEPDRNAEVADTNFVESVEENGDVVFTFTPDEAEVEFEASESEEDVFEFVVGEDTIVDAETVCADNCCPSFVTNADGSTRLHFPPASIVTALGGLFLVVTHFGNLCCCAGCRRRKK